MRPCGYCLIKAISARAAEENKVYSILKDRDGKGYRIFIHPESIKIHAHCNNEAILEEHMVVHLEGPLLPAGCSCS